MDIKENMKNLLPGGKPGKPLFDLAVIGAGPAGSLAAASAAEAGLSVILIEKKKMPRFKPCGGFISSRSLGLLPQDFIVPVEQSAEVYRLNVLRNGRMHSFKSEKRLGILIKRAHFDHSLAVYAKTKGAVLLEETSVCGIETIKTGPHNLSYLINTAPDGSEEISATYIIAADGALSRCAVMAGLRARRPAYSGLGIAELAGNGAIKAEKPGTLTFYPLPAIGGMGWIFTGPGWINRGVGGLAGRRRLQKTFYRLFPEQVEERKYRAWPLPFLGPLKMAAAGNFLLVGDAAGLVEPFSGEGLYNAFISSICAVSSIIKAGEENIAAGAIYNRLFRFRFRKSFVKVLAGAILLHGRSIAAPSSLPLAMAAIMDNKKQL